MIEVKYLPMNHQRYVVARYVIKVGDNGYYMYWGSYDTEEKAYKVAERIGGQVFVREV